MNPNQPSQNIKRKFSLCAQPNSVPYSDENGEFINWLTKFLSIYDNIENITSTSASITINLDDTKKIYKHTPTTNTTYTINKDALHNISSNTIPKFLFIISMGSTLYTINFDNITWLNAPSISATNKTYLFEIISVDNGTTWIGNQIGVSSTNGTVTSVRVQATSPVQSSQDTAQTGTLDTTITLADAYGDTKNPYGNKTANYVLAGPTSGSAVAPSFRLLVKDDIPLNSENAVNGGTTTSLVTTGEKYTWNNKQDSNLIFTNISANNWVADTTYTNFSYKCEISNLTGITSSMTALVIFDPDDNVNNDYANICLTGSNSITIYSKLNSNITIPKIIVFK